MRIKLNEIDLQEILDKHFGGLDTVYDVELTEGSFAIATRYGKRIGEMEKPPESVNVAMRGIFPKMSILLVVKDIKNI